MQTAASKGRLALVDQDGAIVWIEGFGDHKPPYGRFAFMGPMSLQRVHEFYTVPDNRIDYV